MAKIYLQNIIVTLIGRLSTEKKTVMLKRDDDKWQSHINVMFDIEGMRYNVSLSLEPTSLPPNPVYFSPKPTCLPASPTLLFLRSLYFSLNPITLFVMPSSSQKNETLNELILGPEHNKGLDVCDIEKGIKSWDGGSEDIQAQENIERIKFFTRHHSIQSITSSTEGQGEEKAQEKIKFPVIRRLRKFWKGKKDPSLEHDDTLNETSDEYQRKLEKQKEEEEWEKFQVEIRLMNIKKNEDLTIAKIKEKIKKGKIKLHKVKQDEEVTTEEKQLFLRKYNSIKKELEDIERLLYDWPFLLPVMKPRQIMYKHKMDKLILENFYLLDADEDKIEDEDKIQTPEIDPEEIEIKLEEQRLMEEEENIILKHDLENLRKCEQKRITELKKKVEDGEVILKSENLCLPDREKAKKCLEQYHEISGKIKVLKLWEKTWPQFFPVVRPLRRYWEGKLEELILENYSYIVCERDDPFNETSDEYQRKLEEQKQKEEWEKLQTEIGLMKIRAIEEELIEEIKEEIEKGKVKPQKVKKDEDTTIKEKQLFIRKYMDLKRKLQDIEGLFSDWYFLIPSLKPQQMKCKQKIKKLVREYLHLLIKVEDKVTKEDRSKTPEEMKQEEFETEIRLMKIRTNEKAIAEIKKKIKKGKIKLHKVKQDEEVTTEEKQLFLRKYNSIKKELEDIERLLYDWPFLLPVMKPRQIMYKHKMDKLILENFYLLDADEDKIEDEDKIQTPEIDPEEIEIKLEEQRLMEEEENIILKHDLENLRKCEQKRITELKKKVEDGEVILKSENLCLPDREKAKKCLEQYHEISGKIKVLKLWEKTWPQFFPVVRPLRRYWEGKLEELILENYSYIVCERDDPFNETSDEYQKKLEEQKQKEEWEKLQTEIGLMKIRAIEEELIEEIKEEIEKGKVKPQKVKKDEDTTIKEKQLFIRKYMDLKRKLQDIEGLFSDWYFLIPSLKPQQMKCKQKIKKLVREYLHLLIKVEDKVTKEDRSKTPEEMKQEEFETEIRLMKIRTNEKAIAEIKKKIKKGKIKLHEVKQDEEVTTEEKQLFLRKYNSIKKELEDIERLLYDWPFLLPVMKPRQVMYKHKMDKLILENFYLLDADEDKIEDEDKIQTPEIDPEEIEIKLEEQRLMEEEENIILKQDLENLRKCEQKRITGLKKKVEDGEVILKSENLCLHDREKARKCLEQYHEISGKIKDLKLWEKTWPQFFLVVRPLRRYWEGKLEELILENYSYIVSEHDDSPNETSDYERKLEEFKIEIALMKIRATEEELIEGIKEEIEKGKVKPQKVKKDEDTTKKEKQLFIRKYMDLKRKLEDLEGLKQNLEDIEGQFSDWYSPIPSLKPQQMNCKHKIKKLVREYLHLLIKVEDKVTKEDRSKTPEEMKQEEFETEIRLMKIRTNEKAIAEIKKKIKKGKIKLHEVKQDEEVTTEEKQLFLRKYNSIKKELEDIERLLYDWPFLLPVMKPRQIIYKHKMDKLILENFYLLDAYEDKIEDEDKIQTPEIDPEEIEIKLKEQRLMEEEENIILKHDLENLRKCEQKRITELKKKVEDGEVILKSENLCLPDREKAKKCLEQYHEISGKIKDLKLWEKTWPQFFSEVRPLRRHWEGKLKELILDNYSYIVCERDDPFNETSDEYQRTLEEQKQKEEWEKFQTEIGLMTIRTNEKAIAEIKKKIKKGKIKLHEVKQDEEVTTEEKQLFLRKYNSIKKELEDIERLLYDWPFLLPVMKPRQIMYKHKMDKLILENFYLLDADEDKIQTPEIDPEEIEIKLEEQRLMEEEENIILKQDLENLRKCEQKRITELKKKEEDGEVIFKSEILCLPDREKAMKCLEQYHEISGKIKDDDTPEDTIQGDNNRQDTLETIMKKEEGRMEEIEKEREKEKQQAEVKFLNKYDKIQRKLAKAELWEKRLPCLKPLWNLQNKMCNKKLDKLVENNLSLIKPEIKPDPVDPIRNNEGGQKIGNTRKE
ncbi:trichohyalin-like [Palaemon carinicauda]|uniref:trichohyalin-like n=1 Tax=Palaemon carinicauda TaxID=392227 RepID=UPI0035B62541